MPRAFRRAAAGAMEEAADSKRAIAAMLMRGNSRYFAFRFCRSWNGCAANRLHFFDRGGSRDHHGQSANISAAAVAIVTAYPIANHCRMQTVCRRLAFFDSANPNIE